MSDRDDTQKKIDAKRARRPKGWVQRCERCQFWEGELGHEDNHGECHLKAPQVQDPHLLESLGRMVWALEAAANVKHSEDFDYLFESIQHVYWPTTWAHAWCGEFVEHSDKPPDQA